MTWAGRVSDERGRVPGDGGFVDQVADDDLDDLVLGGPEGPTHERDRGSARAGARARNRDGERIRTRDGARDGATSGRDDARGTTRGRQDPPAVPEHVPPDALDESVTAPVTRRAKARAGLIALRQGVRRAARRARGSTPAIVVTALTCGVAYLVSMYLLGQPYPIFAPIIVWIALGFLLDRPPRRVAEIGFGSTLGVLMGEAMVVTFGHGVVQVVVVIIIASVVARFLDGADLFTSQAAVQSLVVTTLPASLLHGGAFGRWAEALVGCTLAILVSTFLRRDPGRRARLLGSSVLSDLASILESTANGLAAGDRRPVDDALAMGRGTQSAIDDWHEAAQTAQDIIRINPALWSQRRAAQDEVHAAEMGDRAVRNARVVARLSIGVADAEGPSPMVSGHVRRLGVAARLLSHAHRADQVPTGAREVLESVSRELSPTLHSLGGWRAQMVESLLRSLAVDLLQVAGVTHGQARGLLPHALGRGARHRDRAAAGGPTSGAPAPAADAPPPSTPAPVSDSPPPSTPSQGVRRESGPDEP